MNRIQILTYYFQWAVWLSGSVAVPLCASHPTDSIRYFPSLYSCNTLFLCQPTDSMRYLNLISFYSCTSVLYASHVTDSIKYCPSLYTFITLCQSTHTFYGVFSCNVRAVFLYATANHPADSTRYFLSIYKFIVLCQHSYRFYKVFP